MHLTKSNKCIILLTIILVLLISLKPAAVAMLKPDENVEVQCDYFYETITILNEPGTVKVSLLIYNLSSEVNLQHLTLTIASYSEYFDEDSIRTYDTESGENISVEPIGRRYKNDPGVYLHEFRLTFDPPLSDKIRTTEISYITNGSKWNDDKTEMILYVMAWSSKILPSGLSVISVDGEGEGFKINPVLKFTLVDFFDIYKTEQRYGVYIWPENLISYPYNDVPIHASYTPAYPSQWHVWDQYQRIEEMFQQINQLLQQTNELVQKTEDSLNFAKYGIIATATVGILGIIGTSYFIQRRNALRTYRGRKGKKVEREEEPPVSIKTPTAFTAMDRLDNLLLFLPLSIAILLNIIGSIGGAKWIIYFIPGLIPILVMPIYIGYIDGTILHNSLGKRIQGWIYFISGLFFYLPLYTYIYSMEIYAKSPALKTFLVLVIPAILAVTLTFALTIIAVKLICEKIFEMGRRKFTTRTRRRLIGVTLLRSLFLVTACYGFALFLGPIYSQVIEFWYSLITVAFATVFFLIFKYLGKFIPPERV